MWYKSHNFIERDQALVWIHNADAFLFTALLN